MREGVQEISEGLIREDGKVLYPISDGIPLLVPEEGISLIEPTSSALLCRDFFL